MAARAPQPRVFWLSYLIHADDPLKDHSPGAVAVEITAAEAARFDPLPSWQRPGPDAAYLAAAKVKARELRLAQADAFNVVEFRAPWRKRLRIVPLNTLLSHRQWVALGLPVGMHNLFDL